MIIQVSYFNKTKSNNKRQFTKSPAPQHILPKIFVKVIIIPNRFSIKIECIPEGHPSMQKCSLTWCFPEQWQIQNSSLDQSGIIIEGRYNYASLSSWEAYRDRQLTTNFELKYFVCRHVSIWGFQNPVCPSVLNPRKEITMASSISVLH